MAATTADKVVVELEAAYQKFLSDTKGAASSFEKALADMVDSGKATERDIKNIFGNIAESADQSDKAEKAGQSFGARFAVGLLKAGIVGILGGQFLDAVVKDAFAMGDLEDAARRAGLAIEKMQEVLFTVRREGLSESQAVKDIERITALIADAANNPRNSLRRLFEVNGITIGGKNADAVLLDLARLMQDAPEGAKTKIAELSGLSEKWIAVLEKGPEAFLAFQKEARNAGAVLDEAAFRKAEAFRASWNEAMTRWQDHSRTTINELLPLLDTLITKALEFASNLAAAANYAKDYAKAAASVFAQSISPTSYEYLNALNDRQLKLARDIAGADLRPTIDAMITARNSSQDFGIPGQDFNQYSNLRKATGKNTTQLPGPFRGDRADSFDREQEQIQKRIDLLQTEARTIGESNYERDRAKAFTELMTAAQKAYGDEVKYEHVERIHELADAYAAAAQRVRETKDAWEAANALAREFGNQAISGIEGLIAGTKNLNQVLGDVLKSLANMALKAAILGEGPLASFFGTKSASGGVGGLMGGILGAFGGFRAAGGGVTPGKSYVVGEKGPEFFTPSVAGYISPNGASMGGGGPRVSMFNDFRDASAAAIPAIMQRLAYLERNFPNMVAPALRNERRTNPWAV